MSDTHKFKILFRIPFTIYFLGLVNFDKKRVLCLCVREFHEGEYVFNEISLHENIESGEYPYKIIKNNE